MTMQTKEMDISKDWEVKKLGEIVKLASGEFLPKNKQVSRKIPVYGGNGITGFHNKSIMEEPTIIVGRVGAYCGSVYLSKGKSWITDNAIYIKKCLDTIEIEYLYRFLSKINITALADISAQPKINQNILNNIIIKFPKNKIEQKKIITTLKDTNEFIKKLENLIIKKKNVNQGITQVLLTGKKRLSGFNKNWEFDEIQSHANITTGSKNTDDKIKEGKYPFFVRSKKVERINTHSFDGEAVLTAGDGDIGKVFHYINGRFDFHQRVYKISHFDDLLDGYFFYLYFSKHFLKRVMSLTAKSTVDSIRMEMITEMLIPLPEKKEQLEIGKILFDMDTEIKKLEQKRDKYIMIKNCMMQKLLTGEIRL